MVRDRLIAIGVLAGLATAWGTGCSGPESTTAEASVAEVRRIPVTVAPVETRSVERTVEVVGTLRGWDEVTVGTKRAGRVVEVLHDIGDRVEPGEPLIKLETIDADLSVEQADRQLRAELAKIGLSGMPSGSFNVDSVPSVIEARVTLEKARRELNRQRSLNLRNATTMQEVQDAEDAERSATASYENAIVGARSTLANAQAAQVALRLAQQALEDTVIRVPEPSERPEGLGGAVLYAVTSREVSEGQMLAAGASVMSLAIENPLKLRGDVPERFAAAIEVGQTVSIRVAAYERSFEGRVQRINPSVDPVSRTFGIEAIVPNEEVSIRPGSFAKASIITQRDDNAITVPLESIVTYAGVTKLFVIEGDTAREVQVLTRLEDPNGVWIEVVGPVQPGSLVAITGMSQLADGTPVTLRETLAADGSPPTTTDVREEPIPSSVSPPLSIDRTPTTSEPKPLTERASSGLETDRP